MMRTWDGENGQEKNRWYLSPGWMVGSSLTAWVLANTFDVFSILTMVQAGGRMAWARFHPAEVFLIYGLLRLLFTLVVPLGAASASHRWPWIGASTWGALSFCALATAATAWWRLYG